MDNTKNAEMEKIELIIGRVLQIGVYIASAVIIIGMIMWVIQGKSGYGATLPTQLSTIMTGIIQLRPYAVLMAGIFLLILTPTLRVVVSIYAFYKEKDYLYVWITAFVLVILIVGMVIGYLGK